MQYEIYSITDHEGNLKEEPEAVSRMKRIVELDLNDIIIGKPLFMSCVKPGFLKSLITSPVQYLSDQSDMLMIETLNSRYFLREVNN